jgi:hypothetical protein
VPDDTLWLMARAGYRPVVELCGGTELAGGYLSSTLLQPQCPSTFSQPAFGARAQKVTWLVSLPGTNIKNDVLQQALHVSWLLLRFHCLQPASM